MQAIRDIFEIWESLADLAREIGVDYQTVAKWSQRKRIPPESWPAVIEAAGRKNVVLTTGMLARLNTPRGSANVLRERQARDRAS